jgi:TolB-like protein
MSAKRDCPIATVVAICLILVATPALAQTRIAVMPFRGIAVPSADLPLVESMADMVSTNLAESRGITVLERAQIKSAFDALKIDDSGAIDRTTAEQIGSWLGATHVVVGSVAVLGKQVRLDSRVVGLKGGVIEKSARAEGARDALFELINTLSSRILVGLTGESVQFNEVSRVILDRDFLIDPPNPSPANAVRFVSQPLFSSVTPGIVVNYVAEYVADPTPANQKQKGVLGVLQGLAGGRFTNVVRMRLLMNDAVIALWDGAQAVANSEQHRDVPIDGVPMTVGVRTGHIATRSVAAASGTAIAIVRVPLKLTIARKAQ